MSSLLGSFDCSLNVIRLLRVVITPSDFVERRKRLEAIGLISGYHFGGVSKILGEAGKQKILQQMFRKSVQIQKLSLGALDLYWFKLEVNICAPVCCQLFDVVSQFCKKLTSLISVFAAYSIRLIISYFCAFSDKVHSFLFCLRRNSTLINENS